MKRRKSRNKCATAEPKRSRSGVMSWDCYIRVPNSWTQFWVSEIGSTIAQICRYSILYGDTRMESRESREQSKWRSLDLCICVCVCVSRGAELVRTVVVMGAKMYPWDTRCWRASLAYFQWFSCCSFFFFLAAQIPWKIKRVELCTYRAMSQTAVLWNQRRAMCPTIPCSAWRWTALRWVLESFFDFASISPEIFERSVVLVSWKELSWNLWYTWTI